MSMGGISEIFVGIMIALWAGYIFSYITKKRFNKPMNRHIHYEDSKLEKSENNWHQDSDWWKR